MNGYSPPTLDKVQNLKDAVIERVEVDGNGINTMRFKRSLDTSDSIQDIALSNEEIHFILPYSNGKVFSGGFIGKHHETPRVSEIYVLNPEADDNEISGSESGILDTTVLNTGYIFSCTSNSNKRIKSTTKVLYEDCHINIGKNLIF